MASRIATLLIAAVIALVAWLCFVLWSTTPFQDCLAREIEAYKAAEKAEKYPPERVFSLLVIDAQADTICAGSVLYEYRDATTALATVFIALFTLTLWLSTKRLWQEAKDTSNRQAWEMQNSLRIANDAAWAADRTANAAVRAADVANREFISSNRPKMIVRRVSLDIQTTDDGESAHIHYIVSNVGNTDATVVESNATTQILTSDHPQENGGAIFPSVLPFSNQTNAIPNRSYVSGVAEAFVAVTDANLSSARWGAVRGTTIILFFGYILYEDGNRVVRRTQFCRAYDYETRRFTVADAEHEYAD